MKGKQICSYLKSVRREVAAANGLDIEIPACTFQGECNGTCPRCEAEVQQLERALKHRQSLAQKVALIGVAAGLAFSNMPSASAQNVLPADSLQPTMLSDSLLPASTREELSNSGALLGCVDGEMTSVRGSMGYDENHVFVAAEYPGGQEQLQNLNLSHLDDLENPSIKKNLEGVVIGFWIRPSGKVYRVKATNRDNRQLNAEIRKLVRSLPAWIPATVDGKAIYSYREVEVMW